MKNWLKKEIKIIGAPFDMGASLFGARLGPEALRIEGLTEKLADLGFTVEDSGNLDIKNDYKNIMENNLKNLDLTKEATEKLSSKVYETLEEDKFPLVIGGDHTLVLGSVKGLLKKYDNPGVIYFDAHADINTEKTSLSGNIHGMPMAFLIGEGSEKMRSVGNINKNLKPENIVYIGLRDVDPGERDYIKNLGIKAYAMEDIDKFGIQKVMEESIDYITKKADQIHISFDVDSLDPKIAPGTGVKVPGGLTFREAKTALRMVSQIEKIVSVELVEVNPLLDNQNDTAKIAVNLLETIFGKTQK